MIICIICQLVVTPDNIGDIGSLLQHFSKFVMGSFFNPQERWQENRLLIETGGLRNTSRHSIYINLFRFLAKLLIDGSGKRIW